MWSPPISGTKLPSTAAKARNSLLLLLHFLFFNSFVGLYQQCWLCKCFWGWWHTAAARLREILECIGLSQENLSQSGVMAAQTLANVAHLLDVKDTETSRYVCFSLEHLLIFQTTVFDSNAWSFWSTSMIGSKQNIVWHSNAWSLEWEFFFSGPYFLAWQCHCGDDGAFTEENWCGGKKDQSAEGVQTAAW